MKRRGPRRSGARGVGIRQRERGRLESLLGRGNHLCERTHVGQRQQADVHCGQRTDFKGRNDVR